MKTLQRLALYYINWVDNIALGFAHFLSFGIPNKGVTIDLLEWHLSGKSDAQQDHARDPEKEDIPSSLEHRRGIKVLEIGCLI